MGTSVTHPVANENFALLLLTGSAPVVAQLSTGMGFWKQQVDKKSSTAQQGSLMGDNGGVPADPKHA